MPQVFACPGMEVGDIQKVGKYVVTVKAQKGVSVEQDCGNRGNEHHIVGQAMNRPRPCTDPHESRKRRHKNLRDHAGAAHKGAMPTAPEGPA